MTWISLQKMTFRAPVGVYEEEKLNLNDLSVDLFIKVNTDKASKSDSLDHTVDYQSLYDITSSILNEGGNLLESVAEKVCKQVLKVHPSVKSVKIKLHKINPPIDGNVKRACVKMQFKR